VAALSDKRLHEAFQVGIILKGLNALAELTLGVVLYFTSVEALTGLIHVLVRDEILGNPDDWVARWVLHAADHMSVAGERFAAWYLISHGVVKLALVAGLLREKMWAYPASLAVMGAFIAYQLYRMTFAFSWGLIALTAFDVVVVWLIWHEYRARRATA
jgi:uncharacterized membrane protein